MPPPRRSSQFAWLIACVCLSALVVGCGTEKPVGDSQKLHPNGIGIDIESRNLPAKPKR